MQNKGWLFFILSICFFYGHTQSISTYERHIPIGYYPYPLFSQVQPHDSTRFAGTAHYRQHLQPFQDVYQSQFHAHYRKKNTHWSIQARTEREGIHISKNGFKASYGIQIPIKNSLRAIAGASIGTVHISNMEGTLVRTFSLPAEWDGTDETGNTLPIGLYLIVFDDGSVQQVSLVK